MKQIVEIDGDVAQIECVREHDVRGRRPDPMAEATGPPRPVLANDLKLESAVDIEPHSDNGMRDMAVPC